MLDDAVAAFLETVSERAFDEPFLALLRANGFSDAHLVHGRDEFGKDVIAKRDGCQWAFQSKAGNTSLPGWRSITGQLDELQRSSLSHPSFDASLCRRCVLVTTGRLNSPASLAAQEYDRYCRSRNEPGIELWDRDRLMEMLAGSPTAALRGGKDGQLLAFIGAIDEGEADMDTVEQFSRRWTSWEHSRLVSVGVLELGIAAERLSQQKRLDLSCHLALGLVRAAWAAGGDEHWGAAQVADAAGAIFEHYARVLRDSATDLVAERRGLLRGAPAPNWVTYPTRAMRLGEVLGLLALRLRQVDDPDADGTADIVAELVAHHPGCGHPVGDRYASSLVPLVLCLSRRHRACAETLLRTATVWLADRYEPDALGLAPDDATPEQELERLLGSPFEFVQLERRSDSYLATVLTDLCAVMGLHELYDDIRNEMLAVDVVATIVIADDVPGQYVRHGEGVFRVTPIDYAEEWPSDGSPVAHHHRGVAGDYVLGRFGRQWDQLAVQAVTRDRHRVDTLRAFA